MVQAESCDAVIVGDTTLAEITPKLTQLFASWKSGDVAKVTIPQAAQPEKDVVYLIDRPGSAQSYIVSAQLARRKAIRMHWLSDW